MPWKLATIACGANGSAASSASTDRLERGDIGRVVMIRRQRAQRRLPAHPAQLREGRVGGGRGRRRAILRIERRDQDPVAAGRLERVDPFGDGGPAVAHRMVDEDFGAERAGQRGGLARGDRRERRALVGPDLPVGVRGLARPGGEDDAAQDRLPDESAGSR